MNINDKVIIFILFDGKNGKSSNSKGYLKISFVHFEQNKDFDIKNTRFVEEQINENKKNILPLLQEIDSSQNSKV